MQSFRTNALNRITITYACDNFKVAGGKEGFGEMNEHVSKAMMIIGHFLGGPFHEILGLSSHRTIRLTGDST